MIERLSEYKIKHLLQKFPCVAIIGPRQVGKTTLAKEISTSFEKTLYLDLELIRDITKLDDPEFFLRQYEDHLVIIDEIQRKPELFPVLRGLIDENRRAGRFILLGSASPELLKNSTESLAGRIAFHELSGFSVSEIKKVYDPKMLWLRGGFPDAFLYPETWLDWMNNFVLTYLERDLPSLGFPADRVTGRHFWSMVSHHHGNLMNYAEIGKSLELSIPTVKRYLHFLENAFLVRILEPYYQNVSKRIIKTPKVYIRDTGILHYFFGIESINELYGHPKKGASWEGFIIEQILQFLPSNRKPWFYRTHDGAEIDLVITKGDQPKASIEIKIGSDARPSRGNTESIKELKTLDNYIIIQEDEDYLLPSGFRVCDINTFIQRYISEI